MALTDRLTLVTAAIIEVFKAEQEALGLRDVWDGDLQMVPETPLLAVIAGAKERSLKGAPVVTRVDLQVALMLYHNRLQEIQKQQREVQELAESVEDVLHRHENQTLGGLVIFGMVTRVEPGYADRQGTILRTTRLTWEAQSQQQLPTS